MKNTHAFAAHRAYALSAFVDRLLASDLLITRGVLLVTHLGEAGKVAGLSLQLLDQDAPRGQGGNAYQHELASNGPYQFFAAFRNNELDYQQFYTNLPTEVVAPQLHREMTEPNATFVGKDPLDIRRNIDNPGTARQPNIVLSNIWAAMAMAAT